MKRFLILVLLIASIAALSFLVISTPETLPSEGSLWRDFKREFFVKYLSCKRDCYSNYHVPLSEVKIDIVILATEKDLSTVRHAIDASYGLIMHPIHKIYLICPESEQLRQIALEKGCEFIEEAKVIPNFSKKLSEDLKQKFIALNSDTICEMDHYLVLRANTILLQTQVFMRNNKAVLRASEYEFKNDSLTYKLRAESLLKLGKYYNLNFGNSCIFFDKSKLKAMKKRLEELNKQPWQDAINNLDFSESEMYANFVLTFFPNEAMIVHDKNVLMPQDRAKGIEWQRGFLSRKYTSAQFICNL